MGIRAIQYMFFYYYFFFFFNDAATTEIYTLSLHDALPISTASTKAPLVYCCWPKPLPPIATSASNLLSVRSKKSTRPFFVSRFASHRERLIYRYGATRAIAPRLVSSFSEASPALRNFMR